MGSILLPAVGARSAPLAATNEVPWRTGPPPQHHRNITHRDTTPRDASPGYSVHWRHKMAGLFWR
jgi:hypothetical protein